MEPGDLRCRCEERAVVDEILRNVRVHIEYVKLPVDLMPHEHQTAHALGATGKGAAVRKPETGCKQVGIGHELEPLGSQAHAFGGQCVAVVRDQQVPDPVPRGYPVDVNHARDPAVVLVQSVAVSYTHLTMTTNREVKISVDAE